MGKSRPLRVGLVIGQLTYGGAEGQLYELAKGLEPDFDVVVYCLSDQDAPYGDRLRAAGITVRTIAARGPFDLSRVVRLARGLRRDRVDLVHAFLFIASSYAYLATRLLRGVVLVTSARNCKIEKNPIRRFFMRRAFRASAAVVCNSSEMAAFATHHYGAPDSAIRVIYNGVDTSRFGPCYDLDKGFVVGTVGRVEKQKNLDMFLEAARVILHQHPDALFEIVGGGSLTPRYEERIAELGMADSVFLRGTTAAIPDFLARLSQFWLTSDWEGTPNVVLEAMAAGVPVIATRVGGTPEVVEDGGCGFLVDAGDVKALCEASLKIAEDENLGRRLGSRGAELAAERFSLRAMVDATEALYSEMLEG